MGCSRAKLDTARRRGRQTTAAMTLTVTSALTKGLGEAMGFPGAKEKVYWTGNPG